ncbi:aspartate dehydrogenase domain-containing protein [Nocardioides sp. NPDC101246]|uniref:aspartate dehydrogenase domain-containing protein n=1 Tax=Nocardioides sp. NPDC101246 TaxID=3364336 RepID=UPI00381C616B
MTKVSIIGAGAIGRPVIEALVAGAVEDIEVVGVVNDTPVGECPVPQIRLAKAIESSDVIVECAGQAVVSRHGVEILEAGRDLLVTSAGALADQELVGALKAAGPGRMFITSGAIGGIDLLVSAASHGAVHRASVTTTKLPATLLQPWMDDETQERIRATSGPTTIFEGSAAEAALYFPRSLNVAATVGLAVGDLELVEVRLVADPAASLTSHVIEADADAGSYRFEIRNHPSAANPRTSGVVSRAVVRSLSMLVGRPVGAVSII